MNAKRWLMRKFFDYMGLGLIAFLWLSAGYSLAVNLWTDGIQGLVLGRYLGYVAQGDHTLAIFAVLIPATLFIYRSRMNLMLGFVFIMLWDYYHEAIWNIPYYLYYGKALYVLQWFVPLLICTCFFYGAGIWRKKEHSFKPMLILLLWIEVITAYLLLTNGGLYSHNVLNPATSMPTDLLVNTYEISEVSMFSVLLYGALSVALDEKKTPILLTTFIGPASSKVK